MSQQKLAHVDHLVPWKASVALSLIGYPEDVARAMAYVSGDTIICADAESAHAVTFGAKVRSVTPNGDVYDPSWTLSGGAPPSGSGMFLRVQELLDAEKACDQARARLAELERGEEAGRDRRDRWKMFSRDVEMKEHELKLLDEQIGGSNAARVRE